MSTEEPNHRKSSRSDILLTLLLCLAVIFGLTYAICSSSFLAMVLNEILFQCHLTAALIAIIWLGAGIWRSLPPQNFPTWTGIWRGLRLFFVLTVFFGLMFGLSYVPSSTASPVLIALATDISACGLIMDWIFWSLYSHDRLLHRVRLLIADRQYAEALEILGPQLARPSVQDLLLAGQAHLCLGNFEEGHRVLNLAITNSRRSTNVLHQVAGIYYRCGHYEEALPIYNELLATDEQSIIASINQCCCLVALRHLDDADEIWQKIKAHPELPRSKRDPTAQSMLEFIRTALE